MPYRRCGRSGLKLPAVSLGLWQNFGHDRPLDDEPRDRPPRVRPRHHALRPREQLRPAVRLGRGELRPAPARTTSRPYRDELVISTKAGYDMWPGPYGDRGSRKYLLASLDQSLGRMGLDYVDIFYSHRFDPDTPLEETMGALDTAVRAGQGAVRRHLVVLGREDARGRRDPARARHAAPDPPAVVLDAEPLDRGRACSTCSATLGVGCIALLAARAGDAHRQVPRRHPGGLARARGRLALAGAAHRRGARARPRAERDRRRRAASRSRRWRSRGRCATRA